MFSRILITFPMWPSKFKNAHLAILELPIFLPKNLIFRLIILKHIMEKSVTALNLSLNS